MRKFLSAKLHGATITHADVHYEGSIAIDTGLLEASGIAVNESVHVWDVTNGARLETYAIAAPAGSGTVMINGAAARLVHPGDKVIIAAWTWLTSEQAAAHHPRVLLLDADNRVSGS